MLGAGGRAGCVADDTHRERGAHAERADHAAALGEGDARAGHHHGAELFARWRQG